MVALFDGGAAVGAAMLGELVMGGAASVGSKILSPHAAEAPSGNVPIGACCLHSRRLSIASYSLPSLELTMRRFILLMASLLMLALGWGILVGDSADPCHETNTCVDDTPLDGAALPTDATPTSLDSN